MAEKREAKKGRTIADPQDLHDVVKAALPEAQFPVGTLETPQIGMVKLLTILPSLWHNDRGDDPSQTKPTSGEAAAMTPAADPERYKHHRFPGAIISRGVWLYYRFT